MIYGRNCHLSLLCMTNSQYSFGIAYGTMLPLLVKTIFLVFFPFADLIVIIVAVVFVFHSCIGKLWTTNDNAKLDWDSSLSHQILSSGSSNSRYALSVWASKLIFFRKSEFPGTKRELFVTWHRWSSGLINETQCLRSWQSISSYKRRFAG